MGLYKKQIGFLKGVLKNVDYYTENVYLMNKHELRFQYSNRYIKPLFLQDEDYILSLRDKLKVKDVVDGEYIRVGSQGDGGYVLLNSFEEVDCVYSIGVGTIISFEDFFAKKEINVHLYDHTVNTINSSSPFLHFHQIGICGEERKDENMITLSEMIKRNNHVDSHSMILQMDVEGFEWEVLQNISNETLGHFDQIVLELHDLHDLSKKDTILKALSVLDSSHQLVHVHANNAGVALEINGWILPNLLEVTYVKRKKYKFQSSTRFFPTENDHRNVQLYPEIVLGYYN